MVVAVFDVDGTLLRGDCLWMAARRAGSPLGRWRAVLCCLPWLVGWQLRRVTTGRFKQELIRAFRICEAINEQQTELRSDRWLEALQQRLRPEALERLRWHQRREDRVLLCSASPRMLLQPLADWLGVELICTELERRDGQWCARLTSPNCKGPQKLRRLEAQLGPLTDLTLEAYGDSRGDRELLEAATIPHYRHFTDGANPYPLFRFGPLLPVVALALLGYGLLGVWSQGDQLLPLLRRLWPSILLGLLLVLLGYGMRFGRWRLILAAVETHPPLGADARIWMGSYAFTATPGKSGEAVRSLLLRQDCQVPLPTSLMALVIERLTDGLAVLLLLLINLPLLLRWQIQLLAPIGMAGLALLILLGLCRNRRLRERLRTMALRLLPGRLEDAGHEGMRALGRMLRPPLLLQATLIGTLAWSLEGVSLWMLLQAMGLHTIEIGGAVIAHTAAGLLGALSLMPGGLGSTEAGTMGLLTLQGVPLAIATPATLLIRLMTLWFATALGVVCLMGSGRRT